MAQLTLRLDEQLAREIKASASASGQSVNAWIGAVLSAAVDPELAGSAAERTRERLARAGLLSTWKPSHERVRPAPERVRKARRAAGKGTPLSQLVSEGRD